MEKLKLEFGNPPKMQSWSMAIQVVFAVSYNYGDLWI
jgi:hypothetical protein